MKAVLIERFSDYISTSSDTLQGCNELSQRLSTAVTMRATCSKS